MTVMDSVQSFIVKDPSTYFHAQFTNKILSIEFAENLWQKVIAQARNVGLSERHKTILRTLLKDSEFCDKIKNEIAQTFVDQIKLARDHIGSLLFDLKKVQNKEETLYALNYIVKGMEMKFLFEMTNLINETTVAKFDGVSGRKDYNQKNDKLNGKLASYVPFLSTLIQELSTEDLRDFVVHSFEAIHIASGLPKDMQGKYQASIQLFSFLVVLKAIVILVKEIAIPIQESIQSDQIEDLMLSSHNPSLNRYLSKDVTELPMTIPFTKTFSQMRMTIDIGSFDEIYTNCAMKMKPYLTELYNEIPDSAAKGIFTLKFSFLEDLSRKEGQAGIRFQLSQKEANIDREKHVEDSMEEYMSYTEDDKKRYKPKIFYKGESGVDAGGLFRGWMTENAKVLFNPAFGLFRYAQNSQMIHPCVISKIVPDYLRYLEYAGYLGIVTNSTIDVHFTRSFYKILLDRPLVLEDLEEIDSILCLSLKWMLENDVDDLCQTFCYELDFAGERHLIELVPDGIAHLLTNLNKKLYVKLIALAKMREEVALEIQAFLKGFNSLLPTSKLQKFSPNELEAIIAGASYIDVEDMKTNIIYSGSYSEDFKIWFWEVLKEFNQSELSAFLYFITGSTKVGYGGFKHEKLTLSHMSNSKSLPVAHTCYRSIDLPEYSSKQILKEKLMQAMFEGAGTFMIS